MGFSDPVRSSKHVFNNRIVTAVNMAPHDGEINVQDEGVECFIFQQYTPGMDSGAALEMIDRVGREVVPLVRSEVDERPSLFAR